jgi:hypothetical protein
MDNHKYKYKVKYINLKNVISTLIKNNKLDISDYNEHFKLINNEDFNLLNLNFDKNEINTDNLFNEVNKIYRTVPNNEKFESNINKVNTNSLGVWHDLPSELYVIGDIHGDFFSLKQSLELTGCVDFDPYNEKLSFNTEDNLYSLNDGCDYYSIGNNVRWNKYKKNCFIVFAGDIIDRCRPNNLSNCYNTINDENCDFKILKLLFDLNADANKYGSKVILVLGNHELLNLNKQFNSDLKYVSQKGKNDENRLININNLIDQNINNIYGIVRINRYIIVHGGINDEYFTDNNLLFNTTDLESIENFNKYLRDNLRSNTSNLFNNNSPFWDRTLGGITKLNVGQCKKIFDENLLNIKQFYNNNQPIFFKIIVAHCPQFSVNKQINLNNCAEYEKRIYRIDIGMSRAFDSYKFNDELLTILNGITPDNILSTDYKYFFNNIHDNSRVVSLLKLTDDKESILFGKLSVEYFYNSAFKYKEDVFLFILSDLKKIINENLKNNINISVLSECLNKINILINYLTNLSKN